MPPTKKERRTVNDNFVATPSQSRKSSISVSEHTFTPTSRRSSTPHILTIHSSNSTSTLKRYPLAPLDPQSQPEFLVKDYADMSNDDDTKSS